MKNTIVYIDGGYVAKVAEHLRDKTGAKMSLVDTVRNLAESQGLNCTKAYYYDAPPMAGMVPIGFRDVVRFERYKRLVRRLERAGNFVVREGRVQRINGSYRQKGVDALVIMDLLEEPFAEEGVDTIIILAGDTDFVPVLQRLREKGIKVILACYPPQPDTTRFGVSDYMLGACDKLVLLKYDATEKEGPAKETPVKAMLVRRMQSELFGGVQILR